jgi:diguanylate cyclase (GGDEF)-like protein/PAS domain S-box-containing protein
MNIFTTLTRRIMLWFVFVGLLPLVLLGYLTLRDNEQSLRDATLLNLSQLADKKALQIRGYLTERIADTRLIARSDVTRDAVVQMSKSYQSAHSGTPEYKKVDARYRPYFERYIDDATMFYDVFLINLQGDIVYSQKHESDFATNLLVGPYRDSGLSDAFLESRLTLESVASTFEFYEPSQVMAAFVAIPVIREGKLLGVIAFQLDITQINQVAADPIGLGSSGETVLARWVDQQQVMIVSPLKGKSESTPLVELNMLQPVPFSKMPNPMHRALSGIRGSGIETDYRNQQVVAAWRYLPDLRLGMVVKMDAEEAFASLHQQRVFSLTALLLVMLFASAAAFYFGRKLVVPLRELVSGAEDVAQGNLARRVNEQGADEIGMLGRAFNRMAKNLQSLYGTLEQRVEQRTRELNAVNERLQQEIYERERISKAVRLDNDFRKEMIDSLPGIFYMLDSSGRFLMWNRNLESVLHCSSEEIAGSHGMDFFEGTDRVLIEENIRKVFETGETSVEAVLVARNGTKTPYLFTGRRIDRNGVPVLVGLGVDIAERKQEEQELRVAAIAFETHEAIVITGSDERIMRVNKAFEKITGYSADEVIGHTPRLLSSGKQDQTFYKAMWQQITATGQWEGEILDKRKNGEIYPKWMMVTKVLDADNRVIHYVGVFSDISQRKLAEEEIFSLAYYDTLTKLPNRRLLQDRFGLALAASERSGNYGAVLFLDLDKFKTLNDTLGHGYGDLLLIEVAGRIKACVRAMDTVARMGGDEFVVLIEAVSADAEEATRKAAHVAEKIRSALVQPYSLDGQEQHSSSSIGVCLYRGRAESVESLLKHADLAMYQAKESGRNTICFFDPVMQQAVEEHAALEADLRRAVSLQQLRLYYQIQLDNEHRPLGAEALLRWIHPTRGMVSPAQFIPLAEETILISEIGHWVIESACRQLKLWEQQARTRDLTIAINVSAQQFAMPDFVGQVAAVLRKHRVDPAHLKLELTESVVLDDVQGTVAIMHALKGLGVGLSMDDFGTGYSSLSYLKILPLDQLKIDQSFVRDITSDPNDAVLVKTIIGMARNFRLNVIAEGVETEAQLAFLRQHGCMAYQGYLFSKPVPLEEFEVLLEKLQGN